jgi:hypothetical protein
MVRHLNGEELKGIGQVSLALEMNEHLQQAKRWVV